jgi:hypothetical protein
MSCGFRDRALGFTLFIMLLELCVAQSHPTKQIATYVLDVDTNMKGEFGAVAPQLTEALQTAFSGKRDTFKILERHHLDQLVEANQLEKDLQAISHGEPASEQFVRQVRADAFIRGELIDGSDGVILTVTLVNLNSEVMWQGQARESRAGWLVHDNQSKDAANLAEEAETHFKLASSGRDEQPQLPASSVGRQAPSASFIPDLHQESPIQPGAFVTGSYRLNVGKFRKDGTHITLPLTLQSLSDKPFRFVVLTISCYLLDENGNRWNQENPDSAGFTWSGVEIDPGMKIKSNFSFVAKDTATGIDYSLVCPESSPQQGRKITIQGISSR